MSKMFFVLTFALFVTGCASKGFKRGDLESQMGTRVKPSYDDEEVKAAFEKKPNLPKPFKLGVYFKSPKNEGTWRWSDQDKALLEEAARDLVEEGLVADVFPIVNTLVPSDDMKDVRLVAAKHQADAILVVSGAGQIDRYVNNAGYSYALLLPTLFVRGSEAETLFVTNAAMWDVKNEYLYLTAETEAVTKDTYVAAWGKRDAELIAEAKTQAVTKLRDELKKMVKGTKL